MLLVLAGLLAACGVALVVRGALGDRIGRLMPIAAAAVVVAGIAAVLAFGGSEDPAPVATEEGVPLAAVVVAGETP